MSAGDLDTTFAGDGSALVQFPGSSFIVSDVAVASDGKVVVSGHKGDTPAVARLNADGSIDTTFASLGLFEFDSSIDRRLESARAVAVQPDGRVLVTGHHGDDFAVARFTTSGALDASWGTSGIATTGIHEDADAYDLAIQPDGKVVVVGDTTEDEYWGLSSDVDFAVVRYNANGTLDTTFDGDGIATAGFGGEDSASAVAIDTFGTPATNPYYGRIVVTGGELLSDDSTYKVARFLPDGHPDNSFDGDGKVSTVVDIKAWPSGVVCQPGGGVVVAGAVGLLGTRNLMMVRYTAAGALDTSFGALNTGKVEDNFVLDDGAISLVAGDTGGLMVGSLTPTGVVVACYTRNGVRDSRFGGGDGLVTVEFGNASAGTFARTGIAAGPGRQIVVAGGTGRAVRVADLEPTVGFLSFDTVSSESGDTAGFWVIRDEPQPTPLRVYLTVGGTATAPGNLKLASDYTGLNLHTSPFTRGSYVDIPANQTFAVVTITPVDDALVEGTELAVFGLASSDAYDANLQSPGITLSIRDNDTWLSVTRAPITGTVFASALMASPASPAPDAMGDATGDGAVNALDLADVKKRLGRSAGDGVSGNAAYSVFADANADGRIDALDLAVVKRRLGRAIDAPALFA
jgi:uncharacterized delta-60 repeat protein